MLEREGDRFRSEISLLESKVCVPKQIYLGLELYFGPVAVSSFSILVLVKFHAMK